MSGEIVKSLEITMPKHAEQEKIGSFFRSLDDLITLHQRKQFCICPKCGIFHNEKTNAWEQRRLGDITESFSGGTPAVGIKEYYGGDIPFIRSAEINSASTELFITKKGLSNSEKISLLYF